MTKNFAEMSWAELKILRRCHGQGLKSFADMSFRGDVILRRSEIRDVRLPVLHSDHQNDQHHMETSTTSYLNSIPTIESATPDSVETGVPLTAEDIERNRKMMANEDAGKLAAVDANRKWEETVAQWREEMGPRGVILDYDLVDRELTEEERNENTLHEGMFFFCELDDNEEEEEDQEEENVMGEVDDEDEDDEEDDDFDVQFIGEDENDGQQLQQQPCQVNAVVAPAVENTVFNSDQHHHLCRYRSIRFSALPPVEHKWSDDGEDESTEEIRDWLIIAADRMRQAESFNRLLAPIFAPEHRQRVYQQRFSEKKEEDEVKMVVGEDLQKTEEANAKTDNV